MADSRFKTVVLLHDREDNPDGRVGNLSSILAEAHPETRFICPITPVTLAADGFNQTIVHLFSVFKPGSLLVGDGLGGLCAMAVQERFPDLHLSAFAINPPTYERTLSVGAYLGPERVVLYSSKYQSLGIMHPEHCAAQAYDMPWLADGMEHSIYAVSYLISAFMRGLDMAKEVALFLPAKAESAGI